MARNQKIRQKPSTKIGGGDYFDGNTYYSGAVPPTSEDPTSMGVLRGIMDRLGTKNQLTKAEYIAAKEAFERGKARSIQFEKDYADIIAKSPHSRFSEPNANYITAELQKRGYRPEEIISSGETTDASGTVISIPVAYNIPPEPIAAKANAMAQMAIPEHTIEGNVSIQPQQIQARRSDVLSDRTQGKIGLIGSKMNKSIDISNQAKRDHIALAQDVNRQIGAPSNNKYGYTPGTVNEAYAYAQEKADSMNGKNDVKSVKGYFADADKYAKSVQANADARGAAIQGQFDASGTQAKQASRMSQIVNHLAKRDVANAQTQQTRMNTQGLINSGPSVMNDSVMSGNSIEEVLKA